MAPAQRDGAGRRPQASSQALLLSCLTIANLLGTGVWLNSYGLDPAHGLVAVAAATYSLYNFEFQVEGGKCKLDVTASLKL